MTKKEEIAVIPQTESTISVFSGQENFENAMKMAEQLAKSDMIPQTYKGKPENCIIALELSNRLKLSPFLVMQNMYIVQGRPSWSSSFIISCINGSGRFTGPLKFEMDAQRTKCRAYATEKASGEKLVGPLITMEMAQHEGWLGKNGSKWKTMPELMLRYRAAAFFVRHIKRGRAGFSAAGLRKVRGSIFLQGLLCQVFPLRRRQAAFLPYYKTGVFHSATDSRKVQFRARLQGRLAVRQSAAAGS